MPVGKTDTGFMTNVWQESEVKVGIGLCDFCWGGDTVIGTGMAIGVIGYKSVMVNVDERMVALQAPACLEIEKQVQGGEW
jgi:hypothetical protein